MTSRLLMPLLLWVILPGTAGADEALQEVTFRDDESQQMQTVRGKVLVEGTAGGVLLLGRDGRLWDVTATEFDSRRKTGDEFQPFSAEELGRRLQKKLGAGFRVVTTRHYVLCTNASLQHAHWCGSLFERLLSSFYTQWRSRKLDLHRPRFPLPAIIFANRRQFADFTKDEFGAAIGSAEGYYSITSNQMILYDLTSGRSRSRAEVNRKLSAVPYNVATIVHEATHQIAFNSGLHRRYADNPMWLTEGMAMYFETPDLDSRKGWDTVGQVNPFRLRRFRRYLSRQGGANSLRTLIRNDDRFRHPEKAADAYAEAWALNYFLIKTRRNQYLDYLKTISQKQRLRWNEPATRLKEFRAAFGEDLAILRRDFLRYMRRIGRRR